jgi:hypothetical protein
MPDMLDYECDDCGDPAATWSIYTKRPMCWKCLRRNRRYGRDTRNRVLLRKNNKDKART